MSVLKTPPLAAGGAAAGSGGAAAGGGGNAAGGGGAAAGGCVVVAPFHNVVPILYTPANTAGWLDGKYLSA